MRVSILAAVCAGYAGGVKAFLSSSSPLTSFGVLHGSLRRTPTEPRPRPQSHASPSWTRESSGRIGDERTLGSSATFVMRSTRKDFTKAGLGVAASWVFSGFGGVGPAGAAGGAVDVMRLRFGDKLRRASKTLDELQQDIFNEDWDLVSTYPNAFRSLVPVFTKYTDAAFPGDNPVDTTSRVALRYEVGRFFGAVERLKRAAEEQNSREAQRAFAAMSVAYDRYLKAGNLYENYDAVTSTEGFYAGISNSSLKFVPPSKDPPKIKDNVLLLAGPDKGKTGYMIGLETGSKADVSQTKAIIKLETSTALGGIREIKVVPLDYVAKTIEQQGDTRTSRSAKSTRS